MSQRRPVPMRWQMFTNSTNSIIVLSVLLAAAGIALLVQSRVQITMLRRRVASGAGTAAVDPVTGLFSAAAAWQRIRGEANRAHRLQRPLHVWIGSANSSGELDVAGATLARELPAGAMGVRIARDRVCLVSCIDSERSPEQLAGELDWISRTIAPSEDAAVEALAFVSEATRA